MQKGTVLNLKHLNSIFLFLKNNWCLITLTIMFLIGLSIGTLVSKDNSKTLDFLKLITDSFLMLRINGNFLTIFLSSVLITLIFLVLVFIFGTSVTGITFIPLIMCIRGILFGSLSTIICSDFSLKGIAFNAIVLIPPTVISVIFLIIAAGEAIRYSLLVTKITLPDTMPKNLAIPFRNYCRKFLILILPTLISALLDAWLSIKLISYFNF